MCLPLSYQAHASNPPNTSAATAAAVPTQQQHAVMSLSSGLSDLEMTREEVVQAVLNAPKRRVDNEISRLSDALHLLEMHLTMLNSVVKAYRSQRNRHLIAGALATLAGAGITSSTVLLALPMELVAGSAAISAAGLVGLAWYFYKQQNAIVESLVDSVSMEKRFDSLYARKIGDKDEFITSIWDRVKDHLAVTVTAAELKSLEPVPKSDLAIIRDMLDHKIPDLRRASAPSFNRPY